MGTTMREKALTRQECASARAAAAGAYGPDGKPEVRAECEHCGAAGYTDGWGAWHFECGRIALTDGEPLEDCPKDLGAAANQYQHRKLPGSSTAATME